MIPSSLLIENNTVLNQFDNLKEKGQFPKLGVYLEKKLVIISFTPTTVTEKMTCLFLKVYYAVLENLGYLEQDLKKINKIEEKIYEYRIQQCLNKITKCLEIDKITKETVSLLEQMIAFNQKHS